MGLRRCCIADCKSASNLPDYNDIKFHAFPTNEVARNVWIKNCRIENSKSLTKSVVVCSKHFQESDFKPPKNSQRFLRNGAVPTIFPWGNEKSLSEHLAEHSQDENVTLESIKEEGDNSVLNESTASTKSTIKKTSARHAKAKSQVDNSKPRSVSADEQSKNETEAKPSEMSPRKSLDSATTPDKSAAAKENMIKSPTKKFDAAMSLNPGAKVEVQDLNGTWLNASVVEVDQTEQEVLISFDKNAKTKGAASFKLNDEWIPMDSSRLRIPLDKNRTKTPASEIQFEKGDRCLARWTDSRKFAATVIEVLENNTYQVLFDDGFPKVVKGIHMSRARRAADKIAQSSPVNTPSAAPLIPMIKKPMKLNPIPKFDLSKFNLPDIPADGEWCCPWINDTPIGREGFLLNADGNKRPTVLVDDSRLPTGWAKHLYQRSSTSGKWDVVLVGPNNKRFRSKNDVKDFLAEIGQNYNPDVYDFSIHKRRAKDIGVYVYTDDYVPPVIPKPANDYKTDSSLDTSLQDFKQEPFPGFSPNESTSSILSRINQEIAGETSTPIKQESMEPEVEKGFINVGALRVQIIDNLFRCPKERCGKNFRKENLLQMHIKHYHEDLAAKLGVCPSVTDLAYLRTIGPVEETSPKNQIPNSQFFEKSFQSEIRTFRKSMSPTQVKCEPKTEYATALAQMAVEPQANESVKRKSTQVNSEIKEKRKPSATDKVISPESVKKSNIEATDESSTSDTFASSTPIRKANTLGETRPSKAKAQIRFKIGNVGKIKSEKGRKGKGAKGLKKKFGKLGRKFKRKTFKLETDEQDLENIGTIVTPTKSFLNKLPSRAHRTKFMQYSKMAPRASNIDYKSESSYVNENGEVIKIVRMRQEEVINCLCPYGEEDGLMIQCELCLCWQHGGCNGIEKESDVPEKYICYICRNPERARESMRYIHDQDWMFEGKLFHANYHPASRQAAQRADILKQSHTLTGNLLELKRSLHSLNVKINIASNKDHPKMYLWSKKWEQSSPRNIEMIAGAHAAKAEQKREVKNVPVPTPNKDTEAKKEVQSGNASDKPKPTQSETNDESNSDLKPEAQEEPTPIQIKENPSVEKKEPETIEKIKPKENPPPSQHITKNVKKSAHVAPNIPEPEAAIDSAECQYRLLEHIQKEQNSILSRMQTIDAQIVALESMDDHPDTNTKADFAKTSQTIRMLLRDLSKMKKLATINEHTVSHNTIESAPFN